MRHPLRWVLTVVVIAVLATMVYAAWLLWDASKQLSAAADDAQTAKAEVLAGDGQKAQDALQDFADHAAIAGDRTNSPVWSLMTDLPWIGDDAAGVRTVSQVADDLAVNGLPGLTTAVGDLGSVLPKNGRIDVATVGSLQQPVARGRAALDEARNRLAKEDPSGYVESLRIRYRDLESKVDAAADALGVADRALAVMPEMLGTDGPRNYLLVFQNNAEIRATGGLPGSVSLLHVDDGQITLTKQRAGSSFGEAPAPVLPLTAAETKLFGQNLGRYFVDGNLTPDFPRSAALWRARWQQVEGDNIDGVISLDTVTLSYLLRALGPVDVDGVQLTSDNVVGELLSNVYARLPEPSDQDAFFRDVAATIFTRVTTFQGSTQSLLNALQDSADEHRLYVHDFDENVQRQLDGTAVAGELNTDEPTTPQIGVYLSDGTLSKMSYYLRYDAQVVATSCSNAVQSYTGKMTLSSTAPTDAKTALPSYVTGTHLPASSAGYQLVVVQIYGPVGGSVAKLDDNELDFDQFMVDYEGRQVRTTYVLLKPGESKDLSWTMTSGPGQQGAARLSVTPSIETGSLSGELSSAC